MNERIQFVTPVGRLVQGDIWKGNDKDMDGRPLTVKSGPNMGQARVEYYVALAIQKTDPGLPELFAKITQAAREGFPGMIDASGNSTNPKFAWKFTDGDSTAPNSRGIRPCDCEGFAGCWVFKFSSGFPVDAYTKLLPESNGTLMKITDPEQLKRGYYIRVAGSVVGNGAQQQPGVFLNHQMVELVAYGDVIHSGPDPTAAFGGAASVPAGASTTPVGGAAAPPATGTSTPPPAAGAAAPPPPPAEDILNPPPPAAEQYRLLAGKRYSDAQLATAGYTPAQIAALPPA